jgi:hypothetical protein
MAMLAPARYIADFARFIANKGSQERRDSQALIELEPAVRARERST